jgi:putative flippase GtrA/SAM-dependent methyltransferase
LGCRSFGGKIPLRSRIGNSITAFVARFLLGKTIHDTQTGLRGIPGTALGDFLRLTPNGYDFEMEMLAAAVTKKMPIIQVPIETVYLNKNESSHFNPLRDSMAVYAVFARHIGNAFVTAFIDYLVFSLALYIGKPLSVSLVCGRIVAGLFNFFAAKKIVFRTKSALVKEFPLYVFVVCVFTYFSYRLINILLSVNVPVLAAKIIVEGSIFFIVFVIQRMIVFNGHESVSTNRATDWNRYYTKRISFSVTRAITAQCIINMLSKAGLGTGREGRAVSSIIELGGGDSCFYACFHRVFPEARYTIIDKNKEGITRFFQKNEGKNVRAVMADLLAGPVSAEKADLVFSVGLIEHFSTADTAKCIRAHFDLVKPGGYVLITYPSPTTLYNIIRRAAEALKIWAFPDERPLTSRETIPLFSRYGAVLQRKMNWWIGLTQEIVLVKAQTGT